PIRLGALPPAIGELRALTFHPTDPILLVADDRDERVTQWDLTAPKTPKQITTLRGHTDIVDDMAYDATGTMAVTASQDGTAEIWSVVNPYRPQKLAVLTGHRGPVLGAAFSADSTTVVTVGTDLTGIVWDISALANIVGDSKQAACQSASGGFNR